MLQVANHTPFTAALAVFADAHGVETAYAVVKATFALGTEAPALAPAQLPLLAADVFWGDPLTSSLRAPGEFTLCKPATDVLLVGRAVAQTPLTRVADVSLRVGPLAKTLRVFGERRWEGSGSRLQPSPPLPWDRVPLRWELAFGGIEPGEGAERDHEPRNPIGRGIVGRDLARLKGTPLPQIEDPAALIRAPEDRPAPAGFAPIAPTWMPRRQHAGTFDAAWQRERAPYLPLDFDARYFHTAPAGLIAPGFLQGGEPVELAGFTLGGPAALHAAGRDAGAAVRLRRRAPAQAGAARNRAVRARRRALPDAVARCAGGRQEAAAAPGTQRALRRVRPRRPPAAAAGAAAGLAAQLCGGDVSARPFVGRQARPRAEVPHDRARPSSSPPPAPSPRWG
jgi:hypothetical protein